MTNVDIICLGLGAAMLGHILGKEYQRVQRERREFKK